MVATQMSICSTAVWDQNEPVVLYLKRGIGLSVFCSRNQAKDHGLRTVQRTAYPT